VWLRGATTRNVRDPADIVLLPVHDVHCNSAALNESGSTEAEISRKKRCCAVRNVAASQKHTAWRKRRGSRLPAVFLIRVTKCFPEIGRDGAYSIPQPCARPRRVFLRFQPNRAIAATPWVQSHAGPQHSSRSPAQQAGCRRDPQHSSRLRR